MSLELFVKHAKIFMHTDSNGAELHYVAHVNAGGTTTRNVPDWVRETATYKHSIKDGTVIDLTPPKPVIIHDTAPEQVEEDDVKMSEADSDDPDGPDVDPNQAQDDSAPAGIDPTQPTATGRTTKKKKKE